MIMNLAIAVAGLFICLIGLLNALYNRYPDQITRRYLIGFFTVLTAYVLFDLLGQLTSGDYAGPAWAPAARITLFLESTFSSMLIPMLTSFLIRSCGEGDGRRDPGMRIVAALWILYMGLLIYTQFSTTIYTIDDQNVYRRGPWYPVLLIPPILMMAVNLFLLWKRRKDLSRLQIFAFGSYMLIPAISMVFQMLFYGVYAIVLGSSIAALVMLMFILNDQAERYYRQEAENSMLRTEIMLSQIQPHFLFNMLGTISHLCTGAPEAKKAVQMFSRYLRGNIDVLSMESLIPFSREMEHTMLYLELEKLRFGDSLQVSCDLQSTEFLIPTLTLQPLAENAVRYGVRGNADGRGKVEIASREYEDHYEISVTDNGPGFLGYSQTEDRSHIGIRNVSERLRMLCGGSLEIASSSETGSKVTILLPKEKKRHDYLRG